jgi:hypothetical protein
MNPTNVEGLSVAVAELATVRGIANSVGTSQLAGQETVRQIREQARQRNVNLLVDQTNFGRDRMDEIFQPIVAERIENIGKRLAALPLSVRFLQKFERVRAAATKDQFESRAIEIYITELLHDLMAELKDATFLRITPEKRAAYEQPTPPFGNEVFDTFPSAQRDVAAASRCFALDEWTACVFHLMRALEQGLRAFASKVGLSADAVAQENWKNVIDQIESKIREIEAQPKSSAKTEMLKAYSLAAAQFRYIKDAWRNHVTHGRATYDEPEAESILSHTRDLMRSLVPIVS